MIALDDDMAARISREGIGGPAPEPPVEPVRASLPPFQDFVELHRVTVYRFLLVAVGARDADDCFQETFLSALRAYPRLHDGEHLDRWILRIASRKAIDQHRRRAASPEPTAELPVTSADEPPHDGPLDGLLWKAVRGLPPRQRHAVVLRHVLDRSYPDIAEAMGSSEEAARANVYQGVKKLRELIA